MRWIPLLSCLLWALSAPAHAAEPPQRIVSLAPSITETLFAVGAGSRVVGVSQFCDYPPQARTRARVGTFLTPNVEAIVALRPNLIIGLESFANSRQMRALQAMGYATVLVRDDTVEAIEQGIETIGRRTGCEAGARRVLNTMTRHFDEVARCLRSAPSESALLLVGHQPMVAAGGGFLDQLLTMAHDRNIAAGLGEMWPRLSVEYVVAASPQILFDGQMGSDPASPLGFWDRYRTIAAVRNHRVYGYNQNPMLRPGPRIWQSLLILARLSHPECFAPGRDSCAGAAPRSPASSDASAASGTSR